MELVDVFYRRQFFFFVSVVCKFGKSESLVVHVFQIWHFSFVLTLFQIGFHLGDVVVRRFTLYSTGLVDQFLSTAHHVQRVGHYSRFQNKHGTRSRGQLT